MEREQRDDKSVSHARVGFGRCRQRHPLVIFFWYVATIGLHNLGAIFKCLYEKHIGDFETSSTGRTQGPASAS